MTEYSKYNIIYRLQKWMDSVPGQTFLNYAYSWGASIVILGTLFKLTHLPGANLMLFIGMGTEVIVFFISAFDRPFDKTADGRELPTSLSKAAAEEAENADEDEQPAVAAAVSQNAHAGARTIIIGNTGNASAAPTSSDNTTELPAAATVAAPVVPSAPEDMAEAQSNYVDELKRLTETLQKVSEQSVRLTRDSEEMENLNRTLTGICKVYEMQLKGASQQIGTIDQINDQTKKMAQQIEQLNKIYQRMIDAMTVNMKAAAPNVNTDDL